MAKAKGLEDYLDELKSITNQMNDGEIRLEDAVGLYKKGNEIANKAEKLLATYEKELTVVYDEEEE